MSRLICPVNIMRLEAPERFFIDCPIDAFPCIEIRRIEVPRELARYITQLQDQIAALEDKESHNE